MTVAERRERERAQRRDHILDAAERAFYTLGLDAARMEHIAEEAMLGKGTLYLYFRNKEQLLMGLAARRQRRMLRAYEDVISRTPDGVGIELVRELLQTYADHLRTPEAHLRLALSRWATGVPFDTEADESSEIESNLQRLFTTVCAAIEAGQADGSIRDDLTAERVAMQLWASVNGALLLCLQVCCLSAHGPLKEAPPMHDHIDIALDCVRPQLAASRERPAPRPLTLEVGS
mgnify:CR=1 FL=1